MTPTLTIAAKKLCLPPDEAELPLRRRLAWCLLIIPVLTGAGCGKPSLSGSMPAFISLRGSVQGGQHAISGSTIQIYAAGTDGNGSAAKPLLSQPAQSDSKGGFSFTFACPSAGSQLYVTAREGNPGFGPGIVNPAIALMAALGPCSELAPASAITVNEATTIGSIWPLASFMSSDSLLGYSPADASFSAATTLVKQLVDVSQGASPGTGIPDGYLVQSSKLDSLADILDACVDSYGGAAGDGSPCGTLFSLGTPRGGSPPTNTLKAALTIAQTPSDNVTSIFDIVPRAGAFQPTLSVSPADWGLPLLPVLSPPMIEPSPGVYAAGQQITLTESILSAVIHYTTDGSSPSAGSSIYGSPFTLASSETIRAIAVEEGISSTSSSASYTVQEALSFSLPSSSITVGSTVSGSIALGRPAATGGVTVTLASSSAWSVGLTPSTIGIAAGQSAGSFTLSGLAAGSSTLTATAAGYNPAATLVTVTAASPPAPPVPPPPSVTTIEPLGAITAAQAVNGLGFNVSPGNAWEFQMAAAAGATHARYQCGWNGTENQTPPPNNTVASPQYTLQSDCQAGLATAASAGIHSTILAAYGSPFHQILTVNLPNGAPAGATSLNVQFASGVGGDTLSSMAPFYDTILSASKAQITSKHSYAGGLIIGVSLSDSTHATLTLASGLTSALPGNTQYVINQYLYPPPASFSPADPSVLAYARYAEFLASKISASGVSGEVEIWNEPPWSDDPWDDRYDFYDQQPLPVSPGPQTAYLPNWGFAAALQAQTTPVAGVTYNWGGTDKSGFNSVLNPQMPANTGVSYRQPNAMVTTESFHPYGNNPEDSLWSEPCLAATIKPYPTAAGSYSACNFFPGPNAGYAVQQTFIQRSINSSWGIEHNITETGFSGANGDDLHKARFVMRQFLGYQAAGVTPIQFYRLYDTSADNFSFVNPTTNADGTHSPLPAYTAIAGLMADLAQIKLAPVAAYTASSLPSIVSYSGTYPLDTFSMAGSRAGDKVNSVLFTVWQRSSAGGKWATLVSPAAAPVTVQIPAGVSVIAVVNLDTRAAVGYTTTGQQITFAVSDDPIEVLVEPAN